MDRHRPGQPHPQAANARLSDCLLQHAQSRPEQTFAARRGGGHGAWQTISYAQILHSARAVALWLLDQGLSVDQPVAILSENDLEHLTLAVGAMWAGVPIVPVSPACSLLSQDFGKLRHILAGTTLKAMAQTLANLRELAPTVYFNGPKGFEELADAMERDSVLRNSFFSRVQCLMYAGAGLSHAVWNRLDSDTNKTAGTRRGRQRPPARPSPPEPPTLPHAPLQSARLSSC